MADVIRDRPPAAGSGWGHVLSEGLDRLGTGAAGPVTVRRLTMADIGLALRRGWEDFGALRSDVIFMCLFYPLAGLIMFRLAAAADLLPLIGPMVIGFAILGPLLATGLYEMSRRRERGEPAGWSSAFAVLRNPGIVPVLVLGSFLVALFGLWLETAWLIHRATLGPGAAPSLLRMIEASLATPEGWRMIGLWALFGAAYAAVALVIGLVSFPMLIDPERRAGLGTALATSVQVARRNPGVTLAWGILVLALVILGSLPFLAGLIVVFPLLGHATWHLYRRAVG